MFVLGIRNTSPLLTMRFPSELSKPELDDGIDGLVRILPCLNSFGINSLEEETPREADAEVFTLEALPTSSGSFC